MTQFIKILISFRFGRKAVIISPLETNSFLCSAVWLLDMYCIYFFTTFSHNYTQNPRSYCIIRIPRGFPTAPEEITVFLLEL
jgi:hypothetical protein